MGILRPSYRINFYLFAIKPAQMASNGADIVNIR